MASSLDAASDANGAFFIVLSEVLLAFVNTIVKSVRGWSTLQMMIVRNCTDLCLCVAICLFLRYQLPERKVALWLLFRSLAYVTFIWFLWEGLQTCLPLGDVVLLVVTFSPIFLVILTRTILGEKIPRLWPLQLSLCMVGTLCIQKPLVPDRSCPLKFALYPIIAAFAGAVMNFASRNIKEVPPPIACVANDLVAVTFAVVSTKMSAQDARILPAHMGSDCWLLMLAGTIGCAGLLSNMKGYQSVSVAAVASVAGYVSVPLGYTMQVVFFGEPIDTLSAFGAVLIVGTNVAVTISKCLAVENQADYKQLQCEADVPEQAAGA